MATEAFPAGCESGFIGSSAPGSRRTLWLPGNIDDGLVTKDGSPLVALPMGQQHGRHLSRSTVSRRPWRSSLTHRAPSTHPPTILSPSSTVLFSSCQLLITPRTTECALQGAGSLASRER
ncbi:hypothetical protein KM043_017892 [Ampulex compressa]|nr:hypothetical protein KM043_017892 [Ampulex compressa]